MKAIVVYESMFGNTAVIAAVIADGLSETYDVTLTDVRDMPPVAGFDLLVLGAPTHAFGMSRPRTRADAADKGEVRPDTEKVGIREFLAQSPPLTGLAAAAFDTKVDKPMTGSAARKALRRLRALGCRTIAPAENFHVTGMTGPLAVGEVDRARRWARTVGASLAPQAT
ncbi:hypothetical protein Q0Z83_046920 [Actinoplanes sichuanensis]|uniref:Flavodoxin family protein n=1 Tax=Actinoplanes sichuanensis TaxID=512349 RepID=A0ABW4A9N4_9ACTN|nr:flavodoxin [Actinoplanes sichuanensis]BEL06501.1 hypothetical protein Q0Z83_046920 [Actinoplanes sichuanensis]